MSDGRDLDYFHNCVQKRVETNEADLLFLFKYFATRNVETFPIKQEKNQTWICESK